MAKTTFRPFQFGQHQDGDGDKNKDKKRENNSKNNVQKNPEGRTFDPDKTAVALSYDPGDVAPRILATGKGVVAEKIIETAKENDVPTYKDNKLADTLSKLKIGDAIPPELYEVVAQILVFVDDMDKLKAKMGNVRR